MDHSTFCCGVVRIFTAAGTFDIPNPAIIFSCRWLLLPTEGSYRKRLRLLHFLYVLPQQPEGSIKEYHLGPGPGRGDPATPIYSRKRLCWESHVKKSKPDKAEREVPV